jgi:hypothetical protein
MCDNVRLWDDVCETQGDLAAAIGTTVAALPLCDVCDDSARDPDMCLCPIDIRAALAEVGLIVVPPFTRPGDQWEWTAIMPGHEEAPT